MASPSESSQGFASPCTDPPSLGQTPRKKNSARAVRSLTSSSNNNNNNNNNTTTTTQQQQQQHRCPNDVSERAAAVVPTDESLFPPTPPALRGHSIIANAPDRPSEWTFRNIVGGGDALSHVRAKTHLFACRRDDDLADDGDDE
jgi:hypothetical protein